MNRGLKRGFLTAVRDGNPTEIRKFLGHFVDDKGFERAERLVERIFHHNPSLDPRAMESARKMLSGMKNGNGHREEQSWPDAESKWHVRNFPSVLYFLAGPDLEWCMKSPLLSPRRG